MPWLSGLMISKRGRWGISFGVPISVKIGNLVAAANMAVLQAVSFCVNSDRGVHAGPGETIDPEDKRGRLPSLKHQGFESASSNSAGKGNFHIYTIFSVCNQCAYQIL